MLYCPPRLCEVDAVLAWWQGGAAIQQLREDTGARIKIEPEIANCTERLVILSSPDEPDVEWCRAQEALFTVLDRLTDSADDSQEAFSAVRVAALVCIRCISLLSSLGMHPSFA